MNVENWHKGRTFHKDGLTGPSQRAEAIFCLGHYFFYGDPSRNLPALGYGFEEERNWAIKEYLEARHNGYSVDINRGGLTPPPRSIGPPPGGQHTRNQSSLKGTRQSALFHGCARTPTAKPTPVKELPTPWTVSKNSSAPSLPLNCRRLLSALGRLYTTTRTSGAPIMRILLPASLQCVRTNITLWWRLLVRKASLLPLSLKKLRRRGSWPLAV
jgi:hypothetical protein